MEHRIMRRKLLNAFTKCRNEVKSRASLAKCLVHIFCAAQIKFIFIEFTANFQFIWFIQSLWPSKRLSEFHIAYQFDPLHRWTERERNNRQIVIWHQTWRWSCMLRANSEWRSKRQTTQPNWRAQDERFFLFFFLWTQTSKTKRHKYVFLSLVSLNGQKTKNIFFLLLYIHKLPSGNKTTKQKIKSTKNKIYISSFVFKFYWRNI